MMKKATILACSILLLGVFAAAQDKRGEDGKSRPGAKCKGNVLTLDEISTLLDGHNALRAAAGVKPVEWNCGIAETAQEWASKGIPGHRPDPEYGENIFVSATASEPVISALNRWKGEQPWWNNSSASCQPGKVCTHFTQIVWKKTKDLGCGINRNMTGRWKTLIVCNYDPIGNNPGPAY